MKKYSFLLMAIVFVFSSCKKSGDGASNTLLLSEVYRNAHLDLQITYSTEKWPLRYDEYGVVGNQSQLSLYILYEYGPNDLISKRKIFTPNDTLNNSYSLSYDNNNRLTRMDWLFPGNTLYNYRLYEYDQQNHVSKYTVKKGSDNANLTYNEYSYDGEGRLDSQKSYSWSTNKWVLNYEIDYTPAGKNVYAHWQKFMTYPADLMVADLVTESKHAIYYDNDGKVTADWTETATNRVLNNAGYVTKQTLTKHFTKPANADDIRTMEYSYIQ